MKKKKKVYRVVEEKAIRLIKDYVEECDGDELARLLGELFGGKCFQDSGDPQCYNFEPNEFYGGIFEEEKIG